MIVTALNKYKGCWLSREFLWRRTVLKKYINSRTHTVERTVEVETVTPPSLAKTAVCKFRECVDRCDEMVSMELDFNLQRCLVGKHQVILLKNQMKLEGEETIRNVERCFHDKGHDPEQLTKKHVSIKQSPLVISTSEILPNLVSK